MRLSTRSRYGLRMIVDIAQNCASGPVPIKEVAKRQGLPVKYLEKLTRDLKKAGFIESRFGAKGGYLLARDPSRITVGELVMVLEGGVSLVDCRKGGKTCPRKDICATCDFWTQINSALRDKLYSFTLDRLIPKKPAQALQTPSARVKARLKTPISPRPRRRR
ncbi:MAG: RrF2 family transcriptional regulator [Desulfovibrionaceae bacterium]|nr:RrF2 family transcriptional regulator [Desulfovibrionaceae bacterium]MDD4952749.1 RrF2 family transcriptional regulator [Desulfovibrionaceae bacterium]